MNHSQLHAIDLAIIGAYLIAMIVIGLVVVKKIKNTDDYYLGGRSFGPLVLMATVCATIIGGSGLMGRAGVAYSSGFKAIMTAFPYLLGMLIFSGFAGEMLDVFLAAYKKAGIAPIPLKAVHTEYNNKWSLYALCEELRREHAAMLLRGNFRK